MSPVEGSRADFQRQQQTKNPLAKLFDQTIVPSKFFPVDGAKGGTLIGDRGTKVIIPENAFVDLKGNPVTGKVDFEFKEIIDKSDIVLSNVPTMANGELLESKGVVFLDAKSEGQPLRIAPDKTIEVEFVNGSKEEGMQGFSGAYDRSGRMNWTPFESPLTADPKTLMFKDGKHDVRAYIISLMENCSPCRGWDKLEVIVDYDPETGRTDQVKTIGRNNCYRAISPDIIQHIVWKGKAEVSGQVKFELNLTLFPQADKSDRNIPTIPPNSSFSHYDSKHERADELAIEMAQERARRAKELADKAEVEGRLKGSTTSVANLGWVNWDKYDDTPNTTEFFVNLKGSAENKNARIFVAYKDANLVMDANQSGPNAYRFSKAPEGIPGYVIGVSYYKEKAYFDVLALESVGEDAKLNLKPISIDELKQQVRKYIN